MSSKYNAYLDYLRSFVDIHTLAMDAQINLYPLFNEIKNLISRYARTITKFKTVQDELVRFVDGLKYDEGDLIYYQDKFESLRVIDEYLQELAGKHIPSYLSSEVKTFISNIYASTSIYDMNGVEAKVLSFYNKVSEGNRHDANRAQTIRTILIFVGLIIFIIYLISSCS